MILVMSLSLGVSSFGNVSRRRISTSLVSAAKPRSTPLPLWIILGAPGSGKGTYAKVLAARFNLEHISTGELVRWALREQRPEHAQWKRDADAGHLLPDDVVVDMLRKRLDQPVNQYSAAVLLDGFPRNSSQAHLLESIAPLHIAVSVVLKDQHILRKIEGRRNCAVCTASYNLADVADEKDQVFMPPILPIGATVSCDGPEPRCSCGGVLERRTDDAASVAHERLRRHRAGASEVEDYFRSRGKLLEYRVRHGMQDMDELSSRIEAHLKSWSFLGCPLRLGQKTPFSRL